MSFSVKGLTKDAQSCLLLPLRQVFVGLCLFHFCICINNLHLDRTDRTQVVFMERSLHRSEKAFRNYFEAHHIWCVTTLLSLPGRAALLTFSLDCFI